MNGDPKSKRFEAYASLRKNGDIQFSDDEMEKLLANEADRKSFHQYLGNQYGEAGTYDEWEADWFPEYSKKKDYGVGGEQSTVSSSATELAKAVTDFSAFAEPTDKSPVQDKGVPVIPADAAIQEEVEPYPIEDFGMARERQPVGSMDTIEKYQDEILKREQSYIKAIEETHSVVLSDPRQAFDLLATDESTKKLHNDPDASDYMKGRLKAQVITDATNLLGGRLAMIEGALRPQDLERYTNAKSALIQIYESGDPNMVVDGRNGAEWMDEWDSMLQSNEDLFEYDALLIKMHDLGASFEGIKDVNPAYFKELEKARNRQFTSDLDFKVNYNGVLKYPRLAGVAATAQVKSWAQGFMGFVASVGNSYNSAAERYDWADKLAEKAARMDWGHGSVIPSFAQRDIFTHVAKVGGYQVDIDSNGGVMAVRDSDGYIVDDPKLSTQIAEQYESAPDKYDAKFRPHLAPAVNAAAQGVVQIAITSRFAGLGRTAAAAKGWAAGALTAQMAGQNYIQALEEFGPQNADVAARFSIAVAALQAGISMYVNPLEIKLNPRFNVSPKTFKAVAADLASGKSKDAVIRNGFRAYSSDMAKGLLAYTKEIGKEGMEGLMEHAVEIGGRKLVRAVTEVNAEYDASAGAAVNAFVSELVGSSLAAGAAVDSRASWQKESMLIAYENRAEILPMVENMHGAEVAANLKLALDAADKRIRGQKLTREQKNEVVVQEYNKITKINEEEAAPTSAAQPEPVVQTPAEPEAQPVVETSKEVVSLPTVYDVAREEAVALRLEAGDSYKGSDGTPYTVVDEGDQTVTLRNEDDGRTFQRNKEELRKEIMTLFNQTYTTAFPEMDFRQIASIRRGMFEQASQGVLALPSPTAVAPATTAAQPETMIEDAEIVPQAQPATPVQTEQAIAPEAQAPALAPAPTTETQAAPAEQQVAAETVPPVAPLVYNRSNIEQAEGIDTAAIATALDVVSEIVPDMQVQVFETQAEMEATLGQRGSAFVSQDGKTIYISKESNAIDVQHEVIHPIMVAAELRNPGTIELFYDQIMNKLPERVRDDLEVFQLGYSDKSQQEQREEVVVEFLARLASGQYEMTVFKQEGVLDAIINWFDAIFVKLGLTNPPNNLTDIKSFSRKIVEAFRTRAAIAFDTEVEVETETEVENEAEETAEGEDLKARFTQDTLDPQYFRAKKWMRDEMNQTPPRLRDAIINDAIGIFGINRGQAEIMYDVLWRSPDMKRMLIPPGVQTNRTGLAGMLDKAQQFRNEWLLKSQGMPMEVLRGLESALGENELLVRRMMESYGRVMKIIDKQPKDQRRDLRELANRFLDGRISDAQIASMPPPLYAELRQMRLRIDEVSAEILNDANMSEMRTEIIGANMGEYIGRYFRVHLFGKYSPEKASIKKFMDEYRRRNYEAVSTTNPTWTAAEIEAELRRKGEQAYKDLLQKHAIDTKTGGQRTSKISKPTGMMKEREQLPKRAGDLWEAIDEQKWGPMTLPPAPGPVSNTGNPEFEAAFNAAWNDMRQYRLREAYFVHPQISAQFKKLEKVGEKLAKLTHSVGFTLTGTNPFSKENIRMAVENRTPFSFASLPPAATPAQIQQFNDMLNELNDGIVDISNRVRDRVNLDMDSIMANKNELDGTDGFRDLEHLTPGVRAILGEIAPLEATVITMANMARYYTMNKYYRTIRALGEGNFLFRADDPNRPTWVNKRIPGREQAVGMVPPDATTEKMAPLSGLYTTPEIYDILMNVEHFSEGVGMPGLWTSTGAFAKFSGKVQEWKTIFSPQTQARNFLSNLFFVVRNAWADPVRMTLGFAYVPVDYLLMRTTGRRISTKDVGYLAPLKQMSDALSFSIAQNFGDNVGSDVTKPMDAAKYGFDPTVASDLSNFHAAKRAMEAGMKRQETRTSLVTDAVNNYGMSEDNARRLHADLQPKTFKDQMSEILNKLAANGVIGTNINMRIIQSYMGEVDTADKAAAYIANAIVYEEASPFMRAVRIGQKNWKDFNSIFGKLYSFGDDTFKIFGYLRERGQYSNLLFNKDYFLLSDEQQAEVDNIAMENVKNIIPNYDRIGKLGKWFSRDPFFAQFIAFKIESMRVWYNLFSLANKEIRDGKASGNAAMVRHGYTRLASHVSMIGVTTAAEIGLTKFLGGTFAQGLQLLGNYMSAFDDDEEEKEKKKALRDPLPDWMQNDVLAISNPVDGKVTYISVSANHPFGDFQRTLVEFSETTQINLTEQPYGVQLGVVAVKELFEQFWQTKIATAVLIEIVSNKDSYGREIWNKATKDYEGDTDGVMFQKILSYAMRRAGPAWIGQASRVGWLDWLPENEFFADFRKPVHAASKTEEIAAMITGFKPITIDFYDQFKRRVGDFANYPGTQDDIYKKAQHWNLRISDATFEEQIKRMVEEEYYTLASLHDAYRLPVKHGIVEAGKMNDVLTNKDRTKGVGLSGNLYSKDGSVNSNGRLTHMIAYGTYSAPWDKISDLVAKRIVAKPDYQPTEELNQWIRNFEMDKQQDENR